MTVPCKRTRHYSRVYYPVQRFILRSARMNSTSLFATIEKPGEEIISWTIQLLEKAGLRVIRTFDLREARLLLEELAAEQALGFGSCR